MIRRPPRSTQSRSSAASDVYKRQRQRRQRRVFDYLSVPQFKGRAAGVDVVRFMPVGRDVLFDFFDGSVTQNLRTQPAGNLTGCPAIRLELPRPLGNRDPTRFRRIISRYRRAATNIAPLAISDPGHSRPVLATPRLSRNEHSTSPTQSVADRIIPALNFNLS